MRERKTYCYCQDSMIDDGDCYRCDPLDDDQYEDAPLYPYGKLAGMTAEQLEQEVERQCEIQGRLGDAEYIDDSAVERAEARYQLVKDEIKRREVATP